MAKKKTVKELEEQLAEARSSLETMSLRADNHYVDMTKWRAAFVEVAKELGGAFQPANSAELAVIERYVTDVLSELKQDLEEKDEELRALRLSSRIEIKALRKVILRGLQGER